MVTKYSDIIALRKSKAAYNIKDEESGDWKNFIANAQFNGILQKVIGSVRNNDADLHKSFWISGTYGTGKSHAGAVIKHFLCDPIEEIADYINEEYANSKYDMLRSDLFKLREQKRLFPVMLYGQSSISHKDDLSLKLQIEISKALEAAGLGDIVDVKTDFANYVNHIETLPDLWDMLIENNPKLKSVTPTRQKLIMELKSGDVKTIGIVRNALRKDKIHIRLDNNDLVEWFFEIQNTLATKTEYNGLLIIWDEFTQVMTSDIGLSLLVAFQEIDEKIMNPDNNSYFMYISHPSALNPLKEDEREKTKGRYHYMLYNMEPVSAFKIMSRKFKTIDENKAQYSKLIEKFYSNCENLLDIYVKSSTNPEETRSDIIKLFPLHPSTANLATYYAREAGSSSRSVFQFIGENDAIRQFINSEEHFSNDDTITADYLWDYVIDEFNANVIKYGAVTERFNSRKNQVANVSAAHFAVFKSILLLNALNNIANNETVTPSEDNIKKLFVGTYIEKQIDEILYYFNENSIIQRQTGGLYSILFSALPPNEVETITGELFKSLFRFTSQVVNFGDTAKDEIEKSFSTIARENQFLLYSEDKNEYSLLDQIDRGYKQTKSYEVFIALLFARNASELYALKEIATKASAEERFKNTVFVVFETVFGNNNYERFVEHQANSICAQRHGFAEQQKTYNEWATKMISDWISNIRRTNFTYYLRGQQDINATSKISATINACVSPIIFSRGPESLEIIQTRYSKTNWEKKSAKATVDYILSFNTKTEIYEKCKGQPAHINYLLQDSVNENLEWKAGVDMNHPLFLVCDFIHKKFEQTNKNQSFNLGEQLIDLTRPPFGLYKSYAGMGMVAFAMRKYVKQIFDMNGKPRDTKHLVEDIVELFETWEKNKKSGKLNFQFETKESRDLCEIFIKLFKLTTLKDYSDVSSLTDARWAIIRGFSKQKGYPIWVLKYITEKEGIKNLIDNIFKICEPNPNDSQNSRLINDTLDGFSASGFEFEIGNFLNTVDSFETGFINFLKSIEHVNIQDNEIDEAKDYIKEHLEGDVGLWTESEVENALKVWKIKKSYKPEPFPEPQKPSESPEPSESLKPTVQPQPPKTDDSYKKKKHSAIGRIHQITDISRAKGLLEKICEIDNETILDIINNYDV